MSTPSVGPPLLGVTEVQVGGRINLYSPSTRQLVTLSETAGDVWRLCDGDHDMASIVGLLAASYQVDPDAIADDVTGAIDDFIALGLLAPPEAI